VELKNWIDKEMKISLSVLDLTGGKSIDELCVKIMSLSSLVPASSSSSSANESSNSTSSPLSESLTSSTVFVCYQRIAAGKTPKARVVAFPYLGGEPSVFKKWTASLPSDVELYAYFPQKSSKWEELMPLLLQELSLIDKEIPAPFVFYGHSIGGLIAYEAASHFRATSTLIVAAMSSPDVPSVFAREWEGWSDNVLETAPLADFMRVSMQQGLIVNTSLDQELIRSSAILIKRYPNWRKANGLDKEKKLVTGKLVAVFADKDQLFKDISQFKTWKDYSKGEFVLQTISGAGHLFINEEEAQRSLIPLLQATIDNAHRL